MQQPVLPEIPKEVLWFILHLKWRGGGGALKSTSLQDIWDKMVGIVSVWPSVTMFRHVLKQILHNGDNRAGKIPIIPVSSKEKTKPTFSAPRCFLWSERSRWAHKGNRNTAKQDVLIWTQPSYTLEYSGGLLNNTDIPAPAPVIPIYLDSGWGPRITHF